jgi:acylphosphatase
MGEAVTLGDLQRLKASVTGRVQGVGFRLFVQEQAERLGLTGYVRNDRNNWRRLEVVAEGNKTSLEELLRQLEQGPPGARVEDLQIYWEQGERKYNSFEVTV